MSDLRSSGWVTQELEFRRSQKNALYVRFTLVEQIGYGEASRKQYYEVWAWEKTAQSLRDQKIGKGAHIWVRGFLELVDYVRKDGKTRDKKLKLRLREWRLWAPENKAGSPLPEKAEGVRAYPDPGPVPVLDGDREPLPE